MTRLWRALMAAAALNMITAGVATAQTVLVRHASSGEAVEVVLNSATAASGVVGTDGAARVAFALPVDALRSGMDARISVDNCAKLRRVHIVERNRQAPPVQDGCSRSDIGGLYLIRRENTLVVSVAGTIPTLLLVKGEFSLKPPTPAPGAARGVVLFGGGGFASFADEIFAACGNVPDCGGDDTVAAVAGGATFWITKWLGLEGGYMKPSKATASGTGTGFEFESKLDAEVVTGGLTLAIPISRVRLYGKGGANFHRAILTTVQTISAASQTIAVQTEGVGWQVGAGIEVWATKWFGLYAEANKMMLKGKPTDDTQGTFNDSLSVAVIGARVRIF